MKNDKSKMNNIWFQVALMAFYPDDELTLRMV